eukprot:scaffold67373_cov69-Phaeocystis_antarctica.AAC.1
MPPPSPPPPSPSPPSPSPSPPPPSPPPPPPSPLPLMTVKMAKAAWETFSQTCSQSSAHKQLPGRLRLCQCAPAAPQLLFGSFERVSERLRRLSPRLPVLTSYALNDMNGPDDAHRGSRIQSEGSEREGGVDVGAEEILPRRLQPDEHLGHLAHRRFHLRHVSLQGLHLRHVGLQGMHLPSQLLDEGVLGRLLGDAGLLQLIAFCSPLVRFATLADEAICRAHPPVLEHGQGVLAVGLARPNAHPQDGVMPGPAVRIRRVVKARRCELIVPPQDNLSVGLRERALGRTALARGDRVAASHCGFPPHDSRHLALQLVDLARQGRLPVPPGFRLELLLPAPAHHPLRRADAPVLEHGQRILAVVHARAHAHTQDGVMLVPPFGGWRVVVATRVQLIVPPKDDLSVTLCSGVVTHG